jgi:uncharacterized protein YecT (DUF1311 family)
VEVVGVVTNNRDGRFSQNFIMTLPDSSICNMKIILTICSLFFFSSGFSQGRIDHIKNMDYMKMRNKVDCNNLPGDNLSERICANLSYQRNDSMLVIVCNKILAEQATDSARQHIISLQQEWRALRDKHCDLVSRQYDGGNGHVKAIAYLNCLIEMTNNRTKELRNLLEE